MSTTVPYIWQSVILEYSDGLRRGAMNDRCTEVYYVDNRSRVVLLQWDCLVDHVSLCTVDSSMVCINRIPRMVFDLWESGKYLRSAFIVSLYFLCIARGTTARLHSKIWKTCGSTRLGPRLSSNIYVQRPCCIWSAHSWCVTNEELWPTGIVRLVVL